MGTGAGDDCCITIIPQSPLLWPAGAGRDMAAFGNRLPGGKMPPEAFVWQGIQALQRSSWAFTGS